MILIHAYKAKVSNSEVSITEVIYVFAKGSELEESQFTAAYFRPKSFKNDYYTDL